MTDGVIFIVYGGFNDPTTNLNLFLVMMPSGRVPWSECIVPAIHRLVQSFVPKPDNGPYKRPKHAVEIRDGVERHVTYSWPRERKKVADWYVDGGNGGRDRWENWSNVSASRYEWNGTELVKVNKA